MKTQDKRKRNSRLMQRGCLLLACVILLPMTSTVAKKPGSEAGHYVRADLPDVDDADFGLFSDTHGEALLCSDGRSVDYAHRDDVDCVPEEDRLWVRTDVSAGGRWMFGVGHDFQSSGDPDSERRLGIDFGQETSCDHPSGDCYADQTNSDSQSLEDRLEDCQANGNGCVSLGGRAWLAYGHWTMDKVFATGVNRHALTVYFQQLDKVDGEVVDFAGLTHLEYINPLYVCEDQALGPDFRIVQTWECGYPVGTGDVSEAEVRIGNPGAKKKSDRVTVVGRFSIPTQMIIQKAGPILP